MYLPEVEPRKVDTIPIDIDELGLFLIQDGCDVRLKYMSRYRNIWANSNAWNDVQDWNKKARELAKLIRNK